MSDETPERILLWVPDFDGFGETTYYDYETSSNIDSEVEHWSSSDGQGDHPEELRVPREKISDIMYDCIDWLADEAKKMWAKAWGESWAEAVEQATGIELDAKFDGVGSEVCISVSADAVRAFWVMSMLDRHEALFDLMQGSRGAERVPDTWEGLNKEDTGLLIQAVLEKRKLEKQVREATRDGVLYDSDLGWQVFQACFDYKKFEAKMEEARQEIAEELAERQGIEAPNPPLIRCPHTLDLFQLAA